MLDQKVLKTESEMAYSENNGFSSVRNELQETEKMAGTFDLRNLNRHEDEASFRLPPINV